MYKTLGYPEQGYNSITFLFITILVCTFAPYSYIMFNMTETV